MMYMDADSDGDIPLLTCSRCSSGCLCVLFTDFLPPLQRFKLGKDALHGFGENCFNEPDSEYATLICLILIFILVT
jgi:hypothetical protein